MLRLFRLLLVPCVIGYGWLSPKLASAWVETRIDTSSTAIELASDGTATVRYDVSLEVRGAPLKGIALEGVDGDAEPIADATVTRMNGGIATSLPLHVQVQASAGRLDIALPIKKGMRGRTFLLKFGYRTRLLDRGLIRHLPGGKRSELAWVGPRFADGVDSVTLVVRTAAAELPPELFTEGAEETVARMENFGIVMSTLRRSHQQDELELVRAHVARDEAITWRVLLDRELFPGAPAEPTPVATSSTSPALAPAVPAPRAPAMPSQLPGIALSALAYALLVWLKTGRVASAGRVRDFRVRAFVPWRPVYRAVAAGSCLGAAAAMVIWGDTPVVAATLMVLAMAFAALRPPEQSQSLRGPGEWQTLDRAAVASTPASVPAVPGAWLDAGRPQGFVLLLTALAATTWLAARWFETSPYYGACLLLGSSALLPLFCTGRLNEMPPDALEESRRFLARAQRRLQRNRELVVQPIGRFAAQSNALDELRLSITPARGLPGLIALELGLEVQERLGGFCTRPVVVVRTADGSACHRALPRGLTWMRGRAAAERASLVRPTLPTLRLTVALIEELIGVMQAPEPGEASPSSRKPSPSRGKIRRDAAPRRLHAV